MFYIVIISAAVFIIGMIGGTLIEFLFFHPAFIVRGEVWRLITWVLIPIGGNIFFVAIALYFYYFIGNTLEQEWGAGKFTIYYLSGVILHILYSTILWFAFGTTVLITPVYLNLSMLFAFATLFPDYTIRLFLVIPIKIKWLALFNAGFFIFEIIRGIIAGYGDGFSIGRTLAALLPLVAVLNYILICGDDLLSYIKPMTIRSSPSVVNFKKAAKQVKRDQNEKPYRHKCAVCGKTDVDYPQLEFRYCSRCNGYHCFCIEHINNHVHFEE